MPSLISLRASISQFPTVKTVLARRLRYLGLRTAQDLLFYLPFRYDDFRATLPISQIQPNSRVTVRGQLQLIANKRSWHSRHFITEAVLADSSGQLKVIWFNQPYLVKILKAGDKIALAGEAKLDKFGLQMINPVFEKDKEGSALVHTGRLVPIYPSTEGVTQKHLRFLIKHSLPALAAVKEWLPSQLLRKYNLLPLPQALAAVHFPPNEVILKKAKDRLQFGELFLLQLRQELTRQELRQSRAPIIEFKEKETRDFVASLPFKLTQAQRRAAWEILQDLANSAPMNRLLDGDVGCGKTVVAALAIYNAALNGYQAALMAPTEILAFQHFQTMSNLFKNYNLKIGLLTSAQKTKGEFDLVIGTHALIEDSVKFSRLGLAIVDEQHRFGVRQRQALRQKAGLVPHFLSLTATPIPRSLALAVYGDLDLSVIKEMPKERRKIITKLVEETNRARAYEFIRGQVKQSRQVFVICPLIGEDASDCPTTQTGGAWGKEKKTVLAEYEKLSKEIFFDLRVSFLHGKMKSKEKEQVMKDFLEKKFDILISTAVVEVGVDVPNASVMMIESAEQFGLAQLHQFRGRVGRSEHQSYCFVFAQALSELTRQRMEYFIASRDGFELAEKDLELRGPGQVFGASQHGFPELKIADLRDVELIKKSRETAREILIDSPDLAKYPMIKFKLTEQERGTHLE